MNWIRQTYIDILVEMADSTILDSIFTDVSGEPTEIEKLSDDLAELIKDAEYPLA